MISVGDKFNENAKICDHRKIVTNKFPSSTMMYLLPIAKLFFEENLLNNILYNLWISLESKVMAIHRQHSDKLLISIDKSNPISIRRKL